MNRCCCCCCCCSCWFHVVAVVVVVVAFAGVTFGSSFSGSSVYMREPMAQRVVVVTSGLRFSGSSVYMCEPMAQRVVVVVVVTFGSRFLYARAHGPAPCCCCYFWLRLFRFK